MSYFGTEVLAWIYGIVELWYFYFVGYDQVDFMLYMYL